MSCNEWDEEWNAKLNVTLEFTRQWIKDSESHVSELHRLREQLLETTDDVELIDEFNRNANVMVNKVKEFLGKWDQTVQYDQPQIDTQPTDINGPLKLMGAERMAVDMCDVNMKILTQRLQGFKSDCKTAKVKTQECFKQLLTSLKALNATGSLIAGGPDMFQFISKVIHSGQALLKLYETSKDFSNMLTMIRNKSLRQSVKLDIQLLEQRRKVIQGYTKELGKRIVAELQVLNKILKTEYNQHNQMIFRHFIGKFDDNFNTINKEMEECRGILSSVEKKIDENSNGDNSLIPRSSYGDFTAILKMITARPEPKQKMTAAPAPRRKKMALAAPRPKSEPAVAATKVTNPFAVSIAGAGSSRMSVEMCDLKIKSLTAEYETFNTECKKANVREERTFQLLSLTLETLTTSGPLMAQCPEMMEFTARVIHSGNALLNVFQLSDYLSQFLKRRITKTSIKKSVEYDIKLVAERKNEIQVHINDLGKRILNELNENKKTKQNQLQYSEFICQFETNFHKIHDEIEECQRHLSSVETMINSNLKKQVVQKNPETDDAEKGKVSAIRSGFRSVFSAATSSLKNAGTTAVIHAVFMANPVTAVIGAAGFAGLGIAGGVQQTQQSILEKTTRKIARVNSKLAHSQRKIKSHIKTE